MNIKELMKGMGEDWRREIDKLIELKKTVGEKYLHSKDKELNEKIFYILELLEKSKDNLGVNTTNMDPLNEFFLKMINKNAFNRRNKK
jgi:fructose-1,6-bisphosphatase